MSSFEGVLDILKQVSLLQEEGSRIGVSDDQAGLCCMVGRVGFVQGTFVQVTFVLVTFVQMKKLT